VGLQYANLLRLEATKLRKKVCNQRLFVPIIHFLVQIVQKQVFMWSWFLNLRDCKPQVFVLVMALAIFEP